MPILEWTGKEKVINHHLEVPYRVLERQYSFDKGGCHEKDNGSENMIIHGDNLSALKSLLPRYEGRVKCIYIDPPYNTGNENWVYNDAVNDPRIKKWLGEVVGKEGEDLSRHDKWLCMMYPRLKLLQRLLADDGAIFISIDDNEQANLKLICNEIFGKRNFVAQVVWQKRTSPDMRKRFSTGHEYIFVYAKNIEFLNNAINLLTLGKSDIAKYKNPDNDPRGPWTSTDYTAQGYRPNQMYTITTPGGKKYTPSDGHCWKNIEEVYLEQLTEGRFWFGNDGNGVPRRKTYLSEREGRNVWTWWTNSEVGHTQEATKEATVIFGSKTIFDYPKPVRLIQRIIQIATDSDSIILDSFAGSGTTAHAVLNMNKTDGGRRKFILIEMMDYAESITAERIKRVINGYGSGKQTVPGTGGDFSYYELGEPLMTGDNLNENVGVDKIREYVYFMETRHCPDVSKEDEPYLLGVHIGMAYYFYYDREKITTLNREFLHTVKTKADGYVIYADLCTLSGAELARFHITFKKIPRDISKL
ncbi:site-specific DNA-methyltransferase [Oxalobacter aliiformigenes]|uniref:site-specific DNA-methyltransferase n=1 Tax=Oxalobacter aliiformigenes TaxID=2946593 RepID=UPI0022B0762A|nr:site-specific DNA-methyltransferase [Oxalobacter aliiformigenes]MCZ4064496.1 site-specific DNA-methyltransferase [Oxalobacter aliiformigenes]WAV99835.1 site-specific DNA-methyltransferase [Oxalobacter aliiformigenes]